MRGFTVVQLQFIDLDAKPVILMPSHQGSAWISLQS
jgi:hypothetical protein